ncbi:MAG: electron transfer flavoprotein subunit beta/FixA family protein [Microbacteriaceae bacterium]|nr:MAG: electron transfer flavoprotein subunit beta/FixA family protein [Microbacteriaceae bacterium]
MKICVLIKQVPDTWNERRLDDTSHAVVRSAGEAVIDEICERALEVALAYKDQNRDVEVVVITMGPSIATEMIKKALAMGADSAVHVVDPALAGADQVVTALTLAHAISQIGFDLVITGNESTDGRGGVIPAMVAEHLNAPLLSQLDEVELTGSGVRATRRTAELTSIVSSTYPAVISVTERNPDPRFPSFRGLMAARKKPVRTVTLAELGGANVPVSSRVLTIAPRPAREAGRKVVDDGGAAAELVEFLAENRLI